MIKNIIPKKKTNRYVKNPKNILNGCNMNNTNIDDNIDDNINDILLNLDLNCHYIPEFNKNGINNINMYYKNNKQICLNYYYLTFFRFKNYTYKIKILKKCFHNVDYLNKKVYVYGYNDDNKFQKIIYTNNKSISTYYEIIIDNIIFTSHNKIICSEYTVLDKIDFYNIVANL